MKKFNEYLHEDLSGALVEPKSASSAQAAKLGLVYVGFGRYEDPRTNQVTHIVNNDRLIPYKKAVKTNSFKKISGDDFGNYMNDLKGDAEQLHDELVDYYLPENFDENELSAIESYTGEDYIDINDKLYSLPTGIPAEQIEPEYSGDNLSDTISALDSALNKMPAPKDFLAYINLGDSYKLEDLSPGKKFRFKGFRSTTLNPSIAMNFGASTTGESRRSQTILIQLHVKKESKGLYVDDFSSVPGEGEFLLPRATAIRITSGPSKLVGSNAYSGQMNQQVLFFSAEIVNNK
jgi:hypothetical protein